MFIVVPFASSTGKAIVAEADLHRGDFLSEKGCRHKLVVSTSFWSWLLNVSSVLTSLKYTATIFVGCYCVLGTMTAHGCFKFLILVLMFLKYVFLCLSLMRSFVVQFFSFFRTLCG